MQNFNREKKKWEETSLKELEKTSIKDLNLEVSENIFIKPTCYMNNSGIAITQLLNYYKTSTVEDIIIIYDDIDINLGNIRFKKEGSAGGHNGIKSIIYVSSNIFKHFIFLKLNYLEIFSIV